MQPNPIRTVETFVWRGVRSRVTVVRNYRIEGWTQLEMQVVAPLRAPLPFAIDGYRREGFEQQVIDAAGGLAPFLTAWAERDAVTSGYAAAVARWKQGDLFR